MKPNDDWLGINILSEMITMKDRFVEVPTPNLRKPEQLVVAKNLGQC